MNDKYHSFEKKASVTMAMLLCITAVVTISQEAANARARCSHMSGCSNEMNL